MKNLILVLLIALILFAGIGTIFDRQSERLANLEALEIERLEGRSFEEVAADTQADVARAGFKSNTAIAATGFGAIVSIQWANAFSMWAVLLIVCAFIWLILSMNKKTRIETYDDTLPNGKFTRKY